MNKVHDQLVTALKVDSPSERRMIAAKTVAIGGLSLLAALVSAVAAVAISLVFVYLGCYCLILLRTPLPLFETVGIAMGSLIGTMLLSLLARSAYHAARDGLVYAYGERVDEFTRIYQTHFPLPQGRQFTLVFEHYLSIAENVRPEPESIAVN